MCGIIGHASCFPTRQRDWLIAGRDAMAHRGPDDAGVWWALDGRVGLGHRRLAIIDLSPAGHQPMHDIGGQLSIVFNGEIYNYRELRQELVAKGHLFRSHGDTEVILAAYREWGVACLARLNGMFSIALYDARQRTLLLARDRAGEKPLFYTLDDDGLRFASELKGLLACPDVARRIDPEALDLYLAMGYVPGDHCLVRGVKKLPPAHALLFSLDTGSISIWPYWQLPAPPKANGKPLADEEQLTDELEGLLEDAVGRQMVADVPVGVLLSGGVDSSLITAMAVRVSSQVKTFTVGFTGFGQFDESDHARRIARHFGTEHNEINAGEITPEVLPQLAYQYDEPIIDSSMIPTCLLTRLVRQHCTVAIGGDGGDELFGGYSHYNRLLWTKDMSRWLPRPVGQAIAYGATHLLPIGSRGRFSLQSLGADFQQGLPLNSMHFDRGARRALLDGAAGKKWRPVAEYILGGRVPQTDDFLQRVTRMDFENYMPDDILVKVDRASMLHSLELRAPLLDYRIIEFAFGQVPAESRATASQRKILLKKLVDRLLPADFDRERKQGFSIPLAEWLKKGPWRDFFHEVLFDPAALFDKKTVRKMIHGLDQGRKNQERLFGLVLLELWRREYSMTL